MQYLGRDRERRWGCMRCSCACMCRCSDAPRTANCLWGHLWSIANDVFSNFSSQAFLFRPQQWEPYPQFADWHKQKGLGFYSSFKPAQHSLSETTELAVFHCSRHEWS
jgi:hypothetical protein